MNNSKIIYGDQVLIDLTNDTVAANNLYQGYTAHGANGELITGTATGGGFVMPPDEIAYQIKLRDLIYNTEENCEFFCINKLGRTSTTYIDFYPLNETDTYSCSGNMYVGHITNNQFVADYPTVGFTNITSTNKFRLTFSDYTENEFVVKFVFDNWGFEVTYPGSGYHQVISEYLINCNIYDTDGALPFSKQYQTIDKVYYIKIARMSNIQNYKEILHFPISVLEMDLSGLDTSHATTFESLFYQSRARKIIGLNQWDTQNLTNTKDMFYLCYNLEEIDLSGWDTEKITTTYEMFRNCYNINKISLLGWRLPVLTTGYYMFVDCDHLSQIDGLNDLQINNNVTTLAYMFADCYNLTAIDLSNWNLTGTTSITSMFTTDSLKYLKLGNWNFNNLSGNPFSKYNLSYLTLGQNCHLSTSIMTSLSSNYLFGYHCYRLTFNNIARCAPTVTTATTIKIRRNLDYKLSDVDKAVLTDKGYTISVSS